MKAKGKVWLPMAIILVLLSVLIVGCSQGTTATATTAPKAATTAAATTAPAAATTAAATSAAPAAAAPAPATSAAAATSAPAKAASGEPIKIGVIQSQALTHGPYMVTMLKAKAKQVNDAGGVLGRPIQLLVEDSNTEAPKAVNAARKLADQGVVALIGDDNSVGTVAIADVAAELKIPHIGDSSVVALTEPVKPWTWILTPNDNTYAKSYLGRVKQLGFTKLGYYYTDTASGQGTLAALKKVLANFGVELVATESTVLNQNDATVQATKLKAANPQSVLIMNYATETAAFYRAIAALGWKPHLIGPSGNISALGKTVGAGFEGTEMVDWWFTDNNPRVLKVQEAAKAIDPNYDLNQSLPYLAWDELLIVTDAIKRAGSTDRAKIRDAMEQTKDLPAESAGPPGFKYTFSAQSHHSGLDMPAKTWKGGAWVSAK